MLPGRQPSAGTRCGERRPRNRGSSTFGTWSSGGEASGLSDAGVGDVVGACLASRSPQGKLYGIAEIKSLSLHRLLGLVPLYTQRATNLIPTSRGESSRIEGGFVRSLAHPLRSCNYCILSIAPCMESDLTAYLPPCLERGCRTAHVPSPCNVADAPMASRTHDRAMCE